jgi:tetratricopeptide (TPR) repeat protein
MGRRVSIAFFTSFLLSCASASANEPPGSTVFDEAAVFARDRNALSKAVTELRAAEADHERYVERYRALELYLTSIRSNKDTDAAIEIIRDSMDSRQDSAATWMLLSVTYNAKMNAASIFGKLGASKDLRYALERVLRLDPSREQALQYLAIYYASAPRIAGGDKERAEELMARLEKISKARWYHAKALIAKRAGEAARMLEFYLTAIREKPNYEQVYLNAAMELDSVGRASDALLVLRNAIEFVAGSSESLYQLARLASSTQSDCDFGISSINTYLDIPVAIRRIPTAKIIYRRGLLHHCLGDDSRAMLDYRAALRLDPDLEDARNAIAAIGPDVSTR